MYHPNKYMDTYYKYILYIYIYIEYKQDNVCFFSTFAFLKVPSNGSRLFAVDEYQVESMD